MSSGGNVIHLNFRPRGFDSQEESAGTKPVLACGICRNKTFVVHCDNGNDEFPMLECAVCNHKIGRVGWWRDE